MEERVGRYCDFEAVRGGNEDFLALAALPFNQHHLSTRTREVSLLQISANRGVDSGAGFDCFIVIE